jgi:hypothetical protein
MMATTAIINIGKLVSGNIQGQAPTIDLVPTTALKSASWHTAGQSLCSGLSAAGES